MAGEPTLKVDDTGEWVQYLHQMLAYHGHPTSEQDVFDPATESSVQRLQRDHGLPETGVVDERTWQALLSEPAPEVFKLRFAEPPCVRDGALVWIIRNEGPGTASQFVEDVNFVDLGTDLQICGVQLTTTEQIPPNETKEAWPITPEHLSDLREGKRYRADITTYLYGDGEQTSIELGLEGGRFTE